MCVTNIAKFTNMVGLFDIRYPYTIHITQAIEFTNLNFHIVLNVIDINTTTDAIHPTNSIISIYLFV